MVFSLRSSTGYVRSNAGISSKNQKYFNLDILPYTITYTAEKGEKQMDTNKELKIAAQDAIAVQNACNLSGVVHAFARAMSAIRESTNGTEEANRHPVAVLFADKIMDLVGRPDFQEFGNAYSECEALSK